MNSESECGTLIFENSRPGPVVGFSTLPDDVACWYYQLSFGDFELVGQPNSRDALGCMESVQLLPGTAWRQSLNSTMYKCYTHRSLGEAIQSEW